MIEHIRPAPYGLNSCGVLHVVELFRNCLFEVHVFQQQTVTKFCVLTANNNVCVMNNVKVAS